MLDGLHRLATLIHPVHPAVLRGVLLQWLTDAHYEAGTLQQRREVSSRGDWVNQNSFGTDRYQFLLRTADTLVRELPDLVVARPHGSLVLNLNGAAIYQFRMENPPHGLVRAGDFREELLSDEPADTGQLELLTGAFLHLGGRELVLLPWAGTDTGGLREAWIGSGALNAEKKIDWDWCLSFDHLVTGSPDGPPGTHLATGFDGPEPKVDLRPRTDEAGTEAG
ncbi:hypothetical protein [Allokutzneria oryzae]|uniref:Uncharacterized protein n=1 Tax=Allokutzneria oryzae TaxID=1378989 RepID=A0ABV5ZVH5_9PSEU